MVYPNGEKPLGVIILLILFFLEGESIMPDNEVLGNTASQPAAEVHTATETANKIDGVFRENTDKKGTGTITYTDGTVLNFVKNAFDHTDATVKKVLKTDKYKYVSPFDVAKAQGKTLDERCYVPGKLGGLMESEVQETAVAIKITYGPTENLTVEDKRATAIEVLVDDEGNLHGDADDYNTLKGSGYYVVQKPEELLAEHPEIIKQYKDAVVRLTKTQIKEVKSDKEGFIEIIYSDDTVVKFDKAGKIVSDGRSAEPEKPYEDFADTLKAKIIENLNTTTVDENGKEVKDVNKIAITDSSEVGTGKYTFNFADGSNVIALNGRIISDTRSFGRRYQSVYTEMIYKYTELLDVATDYFHEDPELTEAEQRRAASLKIMNLPRNLLEKYTANRAMKQARVGHSQNSANSLGIRTTTDRIMESLMAQKWSPNDK
jgi:hypothetical protein